MQARLTGIVLGMRRFLETTLFGEALESVAELSSDAALNEWTEGNGHIESDFGQFLAFSQALGLETLGRGTDVFLSYGAYASERCAGLRARRLQRRHCKRTRSLRQSRRITHLRGSSGARRPARLRARPRPCRTPMRRELIAGARRQGSAAQWSRPARLHASSRTDTRCCGISRRVRAAMCAAA